MTRPEDTHTRTVDDAARFEAMHSDDDDCDDDEAADDDTDDEPCCNNFDCPCGGDGRFGR